MATFSDDELWRSVEHTVRNVLLPAIPASDEWARAAAIQLVGLSRLARADRSATASRQSTGALAGVLDSMSTNPLVADAWSTFDSSAADDPDTIESVVGAILASAVGNISAEADEVRQRLRPLMVARLDADLAINEQLIPFFRGQLDG